MMENNQDSFKIIHFENNGDIENVKHTDFEWRADKAKTNDGKTNDGKTVGFRLIWKLIITGNDSKVLVHYMAEEPIMVSDIMSLQLNQFKNFLLGSFFKYNKGFMNKIPSQSLNYFSSNIKQDEIVKSLENLKS